MNPQKIIHNLELAVQDLKKKHDDIATPKGIREAIKYIIESSADKYYVHSCDRGFLRNDAVKEICKTLNDLKDDDTFQYDFTVTYDQKKIGE